MTRLILWRHGRTEWNATGRWQGQTDIPLDDVGLAQAAQAAPALAALKPDLIVSSDLNRAVQTAQALLSLTGDSLRLDHRLRERDFGAWEGRTVDEIKSAFPVEFDRWRAKLDPVECEPASAVRDRMTAALSGIAEQVPGGIAVVVTHGGAARMGCAGMLDWPMSVAHSLGVVGNCRVVEVDRREGQGWQLRSYNANPLA